MTKERKRLEYLRGELRAERISYDELHELQALVPFIEAGDVELLEAAGVPEHAADEWTALAKEYAIERWCWHDCSEDIEQRADMATERPDEFIDRMAEKWDLSDPADIGMENTTVVQQMRDRITAFLARRAKTS